MEDRGLRPLKIRVCGGVERRGDPFTLCLLFPLYCRGRMHAARARPPPDGPVVPPHSVGRAISPAAPIINFKKSSVRQAALFAPGRRSRCVHSLYSLGRVFRCVKGFSTLKVWKTLWKRWKKPCRRGFCGHSAPPRRTARLTRRGLACTIIAYHSVQRSDC